MSVDLFVDKHGPVGPFADHAIATFHTLGVRTHAAMALRRGERKRPRRVYLNNSASIVMDRSAMPRTFVQTMA